MIDETRRFLILVGLSILIRLFFIIQVPTTWNYEHQGMQAHNDEQSHVNYVRYLLHWKSLPIQTQSGQDKDAFIRNEFEYYQPPAAYLLAALTAKVLAVAPEGNRIVFVCRFVSLLCGVLSIVLFYLLIRKCTINHWASFFTLIYAFLPIQIRHSSSFGNDSMVWVWTLLLLLFINRRHRNSTMDWRSMLLEGVLLGLACWTKTTALLIGGYYILMAVISPGKRRNWIYPVFIGAVIALPYFIRNIILYHEILGIQTGCGAEQAALSTFQPKIWFHFIQTFFITFIFPYDSIQIPWIWRLPAYLIWTMIGLWLILKGVKTAFAAITTKTISQEFSFWLMTAVLLAGMIGYAWNHLQSESRLIFFGIPGVFLAVGDRLYRMKVRQKILLLAGVLYPLLLVIGFA